VPGATRRVARIGSGVSPAGAEPRRVDPAGWGNSQAAVGVRATCGGGRWHDPERPRPADADPVRPLPADADVDPVRPLPADADADVDTGAAHADLDARAADLDARAAHTHVNAHGHTGTAHTHVNGCG